MIGRVVDVQWVLSSGQEATESERLMDVTIATQECTWTLKSWVKFDFVTALCYCRPGRLERR